MASSSTESTASSPLPFGAFPEDVQISILSFLSSAEIASFARTSRRFASLCTQPKLWYSMCDRRWGSKTTIHSWAGGSARCDSFPFSLLYKTLDRWENLIGFWRCIGQGNSGAPLVLFEWGSSFITGSKVSPSAEAGSYGVQKTPFLWMGLSRRGEPVSILHPGCRFESEDDLLKLLSGLGLSYPELVPVSVSFVGGSHFVLEENQSYYGDRCRGDEPGMSDASSLEGTSPPDRLMTEIYQYFANRTSPGGDRTSRRQRKKERGRLGRRRWEAEHFVKITNCYPTPSRPLQGLWKGICETMNLDFYLVMYDDIGGIICRRIGDASEPSSRHSPVLWSSDTMFIEFPFPREEEDIYNNREHIQSVAFNCTDTERGAITRILCISSSYDLAVQDSLRNMEGRVWEYKSGTFGFGFLRDNYIIDLKQIALNGSLLDTVENCNSASCS